MNEARQDVQRPNWQDWVNAFEIARESEQFHFPLAEAIAGLEHDIRSMTEWANTEGGFAYLRKGCDYYTKLAAAEWIQIGYGDGDIFRDDVPRPARPIDGRLGFEPYSPKELQSSDEVWPASRGQADPGSFSPGPLEGPDLRDWEQFVNAIRGMEKQILDNHKTLCTVDESVRELGSLLSGMPGHLEAVRKIHGHYLNSYVVQVSDLRESEKQVYGEEREEIDADAVIQHDSGMLRMTEGLFDKALATTAVRDGIQNLQTSFGRVRAQCEPRPDGFPQRIWTDPARARDDWCHQLVYELIPDRQDWGELLAEIASIRAGVLDLGRFVCRVRLAALDLFHDFLRLQLFLMYAGAVENIMRGWWEVMLCRRRLSDGERNRYWICAAQQHKQFLVE